MDDRRLERDLSFVLLWVGQTLSPRPLGFLLGGFAGSQFGLVPSIVLGGIIGTASTVFWVTPRIVTLRTAPEPVGA